MPDSVSRSPRKRLRPVRGVCMVVEMAFCQGGRKQECPLKFDLQDKIFAYDHRMRLLMLTLLDGHEKSCATFIIQHWL